MTRQWAKDLSLGQLVDEVFRLCRLDVRTSRRGLDYLDVVAMDSTGELRAKKWETTLEEYERIEGAVYARLRGTVEIFEGRVQVRLDAIEPVAAESVDPTPFARVGPGDADRMFGEIRERFARLENPELRRLFDALFADEAFCRAFRLAPAAARNHHSYAGGLVEHVRSLVGLADRLADHYEGLDRELLLAGVLLHDLGKVRELHAGPPFGYTKEGELVGHIVIGVSMLEAILARLPGFPEELRLRLVHLILSHHGEQAWGAPVVPKTFEAVVLHQIDYLDARVHMFQKAVAAPGPGPFTPWEKVFGGRLYRGE